MKIKNTLFSLITVTVMTIGTVNAIETIVIKGSDTLGAKMVPQIAEAFKAKMN